MSICISKSRIATYSGNIPISMSSPPRGCASGLRTFLGRGYEPHRRHAPHRPRWQHCNLAQPGQRGPGRAGRAGVMFCDEKNMWKLSKYTIYIYIYNHLYTFVYIYIRIIYLLHTSYNSWWWTWNKYVEMNGDPLNNLFEKDDDELPETQRPKNFRWFQGIPAPGPITGIIRGGASAWRCHFLGFSMIFHCKQLRSTKWATWRSFEQAGSVIKQKLIWPGKMSRNWRNIQLFRQCTWLIKSGWQKLFRTISLHFISSLGPTVEPFVKDARPVR